MVDQKIIQQLMENQDALYRSLSDLKEAVEFEVANTTKHLKIIHDRIKLIDNYAGKLEKKGDKNFVYLCQHISDLRDIVHPIELKIFPNAARTRGRLKRLLGPKRLAAGEKLDKRKS